MNYKMTCHTTPSQGDGNGDKNEWRGGEDEERQARGASSGAAALLLLLSNIASSRVGTSTSIIGPGLHPSITHAKSEVIFAPEDTQSQTS